MSNELTTITKPKNPGRVAQGHKLVALMKKRKQELLQNNTVVSNNSDTVVSNSSDSVVSNSSDTVHGSTLFYLYGVGALVVIVGGLMIYFKNPKKMDIKPNIEEKHEKQEKIDPFRK